VPGTARAIAPFWAPDSRRFGYFADGQLLVAEVGGAPPNRIAERPGFRQAHPGTWNSDDVLIVADGPALVQVSLRSGAGSPVTTIDSAAGEDLHRFPHFLPDGRQFLFTAYRGLTPLAVYASSLESPALRVKIMDGGSNVRYARGALFFMRDGVLVAQPFDPVTLRLSGAPTPMGADVVANVAYPYAGAFTVADAGALVYESRASDHGLPGNAGARLSWRTRSGAEQLLVAEPMPYRQIEVSPDGRYALTSLIAGRGSNTIWVIDLQRGVRSRLTFGDRENAAVWASRDDVIFNAARGAGLDLYRKRTDASAQEELLYADLRPKTPLHVSPDGRFLLFESFGASTGFDIYVLPLEGQATPRPFAATPYLERWARFSPDGRWVAYMSDESGTRQVYVRRFPEGDRPTMISLDGGTLPRWSRDGREIYFHDRGRMHVAEVRSQADQPLEVTSLTSLFEARQPVGFGRSFYDVAPDGRLLTTMPTQGPGPTPLTLIVNWMALLKSPAPVAEPVR
jgi:hypothetical protein